MPMIACLASPAFPLCGGWDAAQRRTYSLLVNDPMYGDASTTRGESTGATYWLDERWNCTYDSRSGFCMLYTHQSI
jgi:hypothetical protein